GAERWSRTLQWSGRCGLDIESLAGGQGGRQVGHEREIAGQSSVPLIGIGFKEPGRERRREVWSPGLEPSAGNISTSRLNLLRCWIGVGADNSNRSVGLGFEPKDCPGGEIVVCGDRQPTLGWEIPFEGRKN